MTAQILLNILRHSIIKMEAINLLILDECHHAVKKHPYSLVMSEFYHTTPKERRPSVFGMTASPVNLKGMSLLQLVETQLQAFLFQLKLTTSPQRTLSTRTWMRMYHEDIHKKRELILVGFKTYPKKY